MSLSDSVRAGGGIVRSRTLRDAGWSSRALSSAVAGGVLIRPRNGWLALPDADAELVRAARSGVVLTCVTQARRLGLWTLHDGMPHVAAPPHAGRIRIAKDRRGRPKAVVHWGMPLVPRDPSALSDSIENVLVLTASCLPFEEGLAIWESALRKGLVELATMRRMPLTERARRIADAASPFSDSGLETFVGVRLRWLRLPIVPQAWIAGHRVDFLIGERLVLQVDGGTHVGAQREVDVRHDAELMLLGYHVVRIGYHQIVDDWPAVQAVIMRAVAQGLHLAH